MHLRRPSPKHLKAKVRAYPHRFLIVAIFLLLSLVGGTALQHDPPAQAAAINLSATREHNVRLAVNRYVETQVAQREPYCWGGTGPNCFDCSGLVVGAYRYAGVSLPVRRSRDMARWTTPTSLRYARTGDLLFYDFDHDGVVSHVEIFYKKRGTGPRMAVSATHPGGPPVNFHPIRTRGLVKVGKVIR